MGDGVPNASIAITDFVTVTNFHYDTYTANIIEEAFSLVPGQYLVAIEETIFVNIGLAKIQTIFTLGTTWVNWSDNPIGKWSNNQCFKSFVTCLILPNFLDENDW